MRGLAPGLGLLLAVAVQTAATAQSATSTVTIVHGLPRFTADIYVDGEIVLSGFEPREVTDPIELAAGEYQVDIRNAGAAESSEPALSAELTVPGGRELSVVAHLDESGTPTVSVFDNRVSRVPPGKVRLLVRHQAAAPAVQVLSGDRQLLSVASGEQAERVLPAESHDLTVQAVDGAGPLIDDTLQLDEGAAYFVYLIGSTEDETLDLMVQAVAGIQTEPSGVETGTGGFAVDPGFPAWAVALMGAATLALAISVWNLRRRRPAVR